MPLVYIVSLVPDPTQARIQGADEAYQRGNAFYREGRRDKAAALYKKAVGLFPK